VAALAGVRPNVMSIPGGPGTIGGLGEQFEPSVDLRGAREHREGDARAHEGGAHGADPSPGAAA